MAGKMYTWGSGILEFLQESRIKTTWGEGRYEDLGNNWYKVSWNNYHHVIKMNEYASEYMGLRVYPNDFEMCRGFLRK